MKVRLLITLFALVSARDLIAGGDSVFTDEIVVISNKVRVSKLYSPNKIQLIDKDYIRSINGLRLSDVLKFADGIFIKDYGYSSGLKTISQNSAQSEHTLIFLDGIRLNSPQNGVFDLGLLSNEDIESIEISSGGSSALYGSQSVAGVINLSTDHHKNTHFINVSAMSGSYGLKKYYGSISAEPSLNLKLRLSYSQEWSENRYEYYIRKGSVKIIRQRENSDFMNRNLHTRLYFNLGSNLSARINAVLFSSKKGVPGQELGYGYSTARQEDEGFISAVIFSLNKNSYSLNYQHSYSYSLMKYYDPSSFGMPAELNSFHKNNVHESAVNLNYRFSSFSELSSGITAALANIKSDQTLSGSMRNMSFSSTFRYGFGSISIYPSVRYDYYSHLSSRNVFTFRLGANYKPFARHNLSFKSTIGNNFRAPTFNDLYWKDLGNKSLRPERSVSFDAGIYYKTDSPDTEAEINYFSALTTDRILWKPSSGSIWRPVNIGQVRTRGVTVGFNSEFEISKQLKTLIKTSYTYSKAIKTNEDYKGDPTYLKQLIYIPTTSLKTSLVVNYLPVSKIIKLLSYSVFFCYNSRRYTDDENRYYVPAYMVTDMNLMAEFSMSKIFTFFIKGSVDNLFNEEYEVIAGYPQALRGYKLEAGIKY